MGSLCFQGPNAKPKLPTEELADPKTEPLILFEPGDSGTDVSDPTLKRLELDRFLADRLRPHQRIGVSFTFRCLGCASMLSIMMLILGHPAAIARGVFANQS